MKTKEFVERMNFKLTPELVESVAAISRRRMMSRSAYLRQAVLEKLERDGICVTPTETKTAA
jgi:hypothetical protein